MFFARLGTLTTREMTREDETETPSIHALEHGSMGSHEPPTRLGIGIGDDVEEEHFVQGASPELQRKRKTRRYQTRCRGGSSDTPTTT